jgi:RNA polymerase sigma factor (sigma-70 family)
LKSGESDYELLIRPIEDRMVRSIWRIVRDPDRTDDALQDALTTIWRRLDRIRRHANPSALILRICANAGYNMLRRRRVRNAAPLPAGLADPGPSAHDEAAARELRDEVLAAVGHLPRKQALAVLMRVVQEQSYEDIAAALDCSADTARSHAAKGRARLREALVRYAPYAYREERT